MKITNEQRTQLKAIFDAGLVSGLGKGEQTCIEGAIGLVFDQELTDMPSCVAEPDRVWAIKINDARWSSPQARAEALFPIALAQIGTADKDRKAWIEAVVLGTIQKVLPIALRAIDLEKHALACEQVKDLESGKAVCLAAKAAAKDAAYQAYLATYHAYLAAYDDPVYAAAYDVAYDPIHHHAYHAAAAVVAAATAVATEPDTVLKVAVQVALDAYEDS